MLPLNESAMPMATTILARFEMADLARSKNCKAFAYLEDKIACNPTVTLATSLFDPSLPWAMV